MYTLEIPLNTKGYDDFLAKRFKYGYKLKRAVTNWVNCQEHRRVSLDLVLIVANSSDIKN